MNRDEENLQIAVCKYIKMQYRDVIFNSDVASGLHLPKHIAAKAAKMRSSRAQPDLFIAEPRGEYKGMFIELKAHKDDLYKKDDTFRQTAHITRQQTIRLRLLEKGYFAVFAVGFDQAKHIIDTYMKYEKAY